MQFTLTINMDNEAFAQAPAMELRRILDEMLRRVEGY